MVRTGKMAPAHLGIVFVGCPKFDDVPAYLWKLTEIFRNNDTKQVTTSTWKCPAAQGSYTRIATHYFT